MAANILQDLHDVSIGLARVAVNCPTGASQTAKKSQDGDGEESILKLNQIRLWLDTQALDLRATLKSAWTAQCADIIFIIDTSGNISSNDFSNIVRFISSFATSNYGPTGVQIALIADWLKEDSRCQAQMAISLHDCSSREAFIEQLEGVTYHGGLPKINVGVDGLEVMLTKLCKKEAGAGFRGEALTIAILILAGAPEASSAEKEAARTAILHNSIQAKEQGITLFAVGLGESVDMETMQEVSSEPHEQFCFHVEDSDHVGVLKSGMFSAIKKSVKESNEIPQDMEELQSRIQYLQEVLIEAQSRFAVKEKTLHRLQLGDVLCNNIFPTSAGGRGEDGNTPQESLAELLKKHTELTDEILAENKRIDRLRGVCSDYRQQNIDIKKDNREKMSELQKHRKDGQQRQSEHDERLKRLQVKLEGYIDRIVIMRNTLQGLILGSGVHWASDPELENLILSLGKSLEF